MAENDILEMLILALDVTTPGVLCVDLAELGSSELELLYAPGLPEMVAFIRIHAGIMDSARVGVHLALREQGDAFDVELSMTSDVLGSILVEVKV